MLWGPQSVNSSCLLLNTSCSCCHLVFSLREGPDVLIGAHTAGSRVQQAELCGPKEHMRLTVTRALCPAFRLLERLVEVRPGGLLSVTELTRKATGLGRASVTFHSLSAY